MLAHQRTKRIKSRKTKNIPANPKIQKSNPWKETQMPAHKKAEVTESRKSKKPERQRSPHQRAEEASYRRGNQN